MHLLCGWYIFLNFYDCSLQVLMVFGIDWWVAGLGTHLMILGEQAIHLAKLLVVNSMYWLANFPSIQYFQIGRPEVPIYPAAIDLVAQWWASKEVGRGKVYEHQQVFACTTQL